MSITHTNEIYKSKDNKKRKYNNTETNLNLNYSISTVDYEKTDV